jgi:hypothetical protein
MEKKYLQSLLENGEMLFKPSKFFRELEKSDPRMDADDNKPQKIEVVKEGEVVRVGGALIAGFGMQIGGLENIYCFTAVSKTNWKQFLKENNIKKFGDSVLVVEQPKRLLEQAKLIKDTIKGNLITYLPQSEIDKKSVIGPFEKSERYAEEFEYRLAYFSGRDSEVLQIGSISDYSKIIDMDDLDSYIEEKFSSETVS